MIIKAVHVPYTVEEDEDGVWCAHAQLRPSVGANGEGATREVSFPPRGGHWSSYE